MYIVADILRDLHMIRVIKEDVHRLYGNAMSF